MVAQPPILLTIQLTDRCLVAPGEIEFTRNCMKFIEMYLSIVNMRSFGYSSVAESISMRCDQLVRRLLDF